jgi:hypothetical protein
MKLFLIFVLILLLVLFIINKITDTLWFRVHSAKLAQKDRDEKENESINKKIIDGNKLLNDENRLHKIITKIQNGEEVEIPIVAFDYIYRNINKLGIFGKDGTLNIVNKEQYLEFKNTAIRLVNENTDSQDQTSQNDDDFVTKPATQKLIDIQKYEDGTIVKKDFLTDSIELIKPDGKKYIQDGASNKLTIQTIKAKEETKEQKNTDHHKEKIKIDKLETKINILQNKVENASKKVVIEEEQVVKNEQKQPKKEESKNINLDNLLSSYTNKKTKKIKEKKHTNFFTRYH